MVAAPWARPTRGDAFRSCGRVCEARKTEFVAAEPSACPTLTRGAYRYDFGDTAGMTPLMPMYTLGHDFVPPPVHAGGLRYHGDSPIVCALVKQGLVEARAYKQNETFEAALRFARTEAILPAPEPSHAIRAVIEEAEAAKQAGEERVILLTCAARHSTCRVRGDIAGKLETRVPEQHGGRAGAVAGGAGDRGARAKGIGGGSSAPAIPRPSAAGTRSTSASRSSRSGSRRRGRRSGAHSGPTPTTSVAPNRRG